MTNLFAMLLPYIAVLIGLYWFHSAWWAIGLYHIGILGFMGYRRPKGLLQKLRTGITAKLLVPGLLVCSLAGPVVYFMWPWFSASGNVLPDWMSRYGLTGWKWLVLIPYFSIVHPVLEELHWQEVSPQRFVWACPQDFLFAGYHVLVLFQLMMWPWLIMVFAVLLTSSVFWRWTADRLGGYALPVLTHAMADAAVVVAVFFLLTG